jgi:poly(A) polymerase
MQLKDLINFKDSQFIFDVLLKEDGDPRFVGGCVRNVLMGRDIKDIDVGTRLLPNVVEKLFTAYPNVKVIDVGKEFGTVRIAMNLNSYEITTLRKDVHTDGRYAVVEYTDNWEEDASRRDLTINGMSYSPKHDKLYDYFDGQKDLKSGLIRFIGEAHERVKEDYLRILRLFRFYTYCGKTIDKASFDACKTYAKEMDRLSKERKMNELYMILHHEDYMDTLELMKENNILEHVSGFVDWRSGINLCKRLEDLCSSYDCGFSLMLKIFSLFQKTNLASYKITQEFITLSSEEKKYLTDLSRFISCCSLSEVMKKPHYFLYYHQKVFLDGFLYLQAIEFKEDKIIFGKIKKISEQALPDFPLSGSDLMSKFYLEQGKELGELLRDARAFWIESEFKTDKETLLEYIKTIRPSL